jgi:hypothetical protein
VRGPALVEELLPARLGDRRGWAEDMYAAMTALRVEPTAENVCAVIAIIEQESSFRVDPSIPGPAGAGAARARQAARARWRTQGGGGVGAQARLVGRPYLLPTARRRDDRATPLGHVRGFRQPRAARQVALRRAEPGAQRRPDAGEHRFRATLRSFQPLSLRCAGSIRTRCSPAGGGLYFGIAHLFDYDAPYDDLRYRFADYNAGRYASRNAAFQKAVGELAGAALELDGDLVRFEQGKPTREVSRTEAAVRTLAGHFEMTNAEVRGDLELGQSAEFERSRLYLSVFTMVDGVLGRRAPRAVVPMIVVESFKTPRRLTSYGYAMRVSERHKACMAQL